MIIGILVGITGIVLTIQYSEIAYEREGDVIIPTIEDLDYLVNDAIIRCETDGECDIMSGWLEVCKNEPEYKDVPSWHDGRIEQLIENW